MNEYGSLRVPQYSQKSVFADDWAFCTGELLQGEPWFSAVEPEGPVLARHTRRAG